MLAANLRASYSVVVLTGRWVLRHAGSRAQEEQEAARLLFKAAYPRLAGWAAAATGSPASGHDVAAEAFARLLRRWGSIDNHEAYLWQIATNVVRDHWRRRQRDEALIARLQPIAPGSTPGPDRSLIDLVARLPERLRLAVLLHYFADLPISDVAAAMKRPPGTVKRWLSEARNLLAAQLREETQHVG